MARKPSAKQTVVVTTRAQVAIVNPRDIAELEEAHGRARVLAVGVSDYPKATGFAALPVCNHDARSVRDRFLDIRQLHADPKFCLACTTNGGSAPTRGEILRLLHELADGADSENRLVFFYSGHGHHLLMSGADEFFLVPQDAYASDKPDALIAFSQVKEILSASAARQKLIILDACFGGPDVTHMKALPPQLSAKFLKEYLANTRGTAVLSSSGIDQKSTTQSPNPKLSLFTHYLCEALSGAPEALDNGRLTLQSLFDYLSVVVRKQAKSYHQPQQPALALAVQGTMMLADFTVGSLVPAGVELTEHPVTDVSFRESARGKVTDILTDIKRWHYSQEYLEQQVNNNIEKVYRQRFGEFAASLTEDVGIPYGEIAVDTNGVTFPHGGYSMEYKAEDQKTGVFRHTVWFDRSWFDRPERMIEVLHCFDLRPREMTLELSQERSLDSMIAGLRSRGWKLESNELPQKFTASHEQYRVVVSRTRIRFSGFYPDEILGSESAPEKAALVTGILGLLANGKANA
jgi:hypothetical protein